VSDASVPVRWGPPPPGPGARFAAWLRGLAGAKPQMVEHLPELPVVLRRAPLAVPYLEAERDGDQRRAGAAAMAAAEAGIAAEAWWAADLWAHRALWHFERADMALQSTRAARRIGDLRVAGGDPTSARRYYAEAISEARDLGAEREEGLAAYGMGRAELELGRVTDARKLARIAVDLLERCNAPAEEVDAARRLLGTERAVGEDR
jgi:tetratricopeptide (TPR) repeat protein